MTMLPNCIISVISIVFLIYSFITIFIKKAKVINILTYTIGIIISILLLSMSIYGIFFNLPLGEVQHLVESNFK